MTSVQEKIFETEHLHKNNNSESWCLTLYFSRFNSILFLSLTLKSNKNSIIIYNVNNFMLKFCVLTYFDRYKNKVVKHFA